MQTSLVDLRRRPGLAFDAMEKRQEVVVTKRGVPLAKIVPLGNPAAKAVREHEAFGMWRDSEGLSVAEQVRQLRKGRLHDL